MAIRLISATLLLGLFAQAPPATYNQAIIFLRGAFNLSAAEIARLDAGSVVARTLDVANSREVATLGVVRIKTPPARYIERLTDITTFKQTAGVMQIAKFSSPPQAKDVAALSIDSADLKRLRECRVNDCEIRLGADGIERARRDIDWLAPDVSAKANRLVGQILLEYVTKYRQAGADATMEYANRQPRLNVGREFASLLDGDPISLAHAPRLRRHLIDYPAPAEQMTDFVYWSKELVRGKPVVSITHVAVAAAVDDSPVAYAVGSKQIYAMHYYDASLGLTLLVPERQASTTTTYLVYLNRSRIDLFDGFFGGITRRIVAGKARTLVADQLQRLQGVLATPTATAPDAERTR